MYLCKDGSTSFVSKNFFASLNLAKVKPSDWFDVANLDVLGSATEVPPVTPASADALKAVIITSSILLPIAAAAAFA